MNDSPKADGAMDRAPRLVFLCIGALALIHGLRGWIDPNEDLRLVARLAFFAIDFSAYFDIKGLSENLALNPEETRALAAASQGRFHTLLTYALLHANVQHLFVNCIWLAAFGVALARRFGAPRFLAFNACCAIIGALAQWAANPYSVAPLIGASACVSGVIGAVTRFAFAPGAPLDQRHIGHASIESYRLPAQPLKAIIFSPREMAVIAIWLVLNLIFGILGVGAPDDATIAWQAHVGGFLMGFLGFAWFDPISKDQSGARP